MAYNNPVPGLAGTNKPIKESTIGAQIKTDLFVRDSLDRLINDRFFTPLGVTRNLPKNMGKNIKQYVYFAILDDENINSMGLDGSGDTDYIKYLGGAGAVIDNKWSVWAVNHKNLHNRVLDYQTGTGLMSKTEGIHLATGAAGGTGKPNDYVLGAITGNNLHKEFVFGEAPNRRSAYLHAIGTDSDTASDWKVYDAEMSTFNMQQSVLLASNITRAEAEKVKLPVIMKQNSGNLYGGSRNINTITNNLPRLNEFGGWKNRVSIRRKVIEGSVFMNGFYKVFTKQELDFDTDTHLLERSVNEVLETAHEVTEDMLQGDLINAATNTGTMHMAGTAIVPEEVTEGISYRDIKKWSTALAKNRVPKKTKIVTGSRLTDTKTIDASWIVYTAEEMIDVFEEMKDYHGNPAWTPVKQYGAATKLLNGERGSVGPFRFIVNPLMQNSVNKLGNPIYPMLLIGDESFSTINFMGNSTNGARPTKDGKNSVGRYTTQFIKPGGDGSNTLDPFAQTGYFSILWYYGFMTLRNERLSIFWTTDKVDNT